MNIDKISTYLLNNDAVDTKKRSLWLLIWHTATLFYLTWLLISGAGFDISSIVITLCLAAVPLALNYLSCRHYISDPVSHVSFSGDYMYIGRNKIRIDSVRKVSLDLSEGEGRFSLPLNFTPFGKVRDFRFPPSHYVSFCRHLNAHLPSAVTHFE